jgi:hypothetical protein
MAFAKSARAIGSSDRLFPFQVSKKHSTTLSSARFVLRRGHANVAGDKQQPFFLQTEVNCHTTPLQPQAQLSLILALLIGKANYPPNTTLKHLSELLIQRNIRRWHRGLLRVRLMPSDMVIHRIPAFVA